MKGNLPSIALRTGFACAAFALAQAAPAQRLPLERIKLPPGFEISVFADGVPEARSLALGKGNVLFAGTRADRVYAVRYREAKAVQVITLASGLRMPNGVAFATRWDSTGIRTRRNCGSPTTAATCWATSCPRTS